MKRYIFIIFTLVIAYSADHIILTRVVTQPHEAESFSIYNPTPSSIDLTHYYVCDNQDYYKIAIFPDSIFSSSHTGFTAKFPSVNIEPGETLTIVLHENYNAYYGDGFIPDIVMFESDEYLSMSGSIGLGNSKIDESSEFIILFKWDGASNLIQDIDYFLWWSLEGVNLNGIDKTGEISYKNDTPIETQLDFKDLAQKYYAYSRKSIIENDESGTDGNGITGHDETSENFRDSWEIIALFDLGCTDPYACNYDAFAVEDDESCEYTSCNIPFSYILNDAYDCNYNSLGYCNSDPNCPVVKIKGIMVDYFDVTVYNGPHAVTLEDEYGYRIELSIWPDEWNLEEDPLGYFIKAPFNRFIMQAEGSVFEYEGDKQVLICGPENAEVLSEVNFSGDYVSNTEALIDISPAPFVLLPSYGETLDFSYSFPDESRVIIRILDLSGRFVTSLVDQYYQDSGTVSRIEPSSAWDGRDHLGQIVSPGTYIMHIEAMNPVSGQTHTDAAPVVVGVKN